MSGTVTTAGDSCGGCAVSKRGAPWNAMNTSRKVYAAVTNTQESTASQANTCPGVLEWRTASMIASLEKKPASPGMPAEEMAPMRSVQYVSGRYFFKPPMRRMSCSWCRAMMTEPAARNSTALKKAWVTRWNIAAEYAEAPSAAVM